MSYFSVNYMLQPVKDASAICNVMKFLGINEDTISKADYQLQKINLVDWVNKMNTEKFWSKVGDYKNASGSNPFLELYQCAISVLIFPHSNAEIERVFSCMNYVKSKLRNSMSLKVLNAILTIKFGLIRVGKCCSTYDLPSHVLKEIGTLASYQSHDVNQEAGASLSSDDSQSSQNDEENFEELFYW